MVSSLSDSDGSDDDDSVAALSPESAVDSDSDADSSAGSSDGGSSAGDSSDGAFGDSSSDASDGWHLYRRRRKRDGALSSPKRKMLKKQHKQRN